MAVYRAANLELYHGNACRACLHSIIFDILLNVFVVDLARRSQCCCPMLKLCCAVHPADAWHVDHVYVVYQLPRVNGLALSNCTALCGRYIPMYVFCFGLPGVSPITTLSLAVQYLRVDRSSFSSETCYYYWPESATSWAPLRGSAFWSTHSS